jgi:hypothetical protein
MRYSLQNFEDCTIFLLGQLYDLWINHKSYIFLYKKISKI